MPIKMQHFGTTKSIFRWLLVTCCVWGFLATACHAQPLHPQDLEALSDLFNSVTGWPNPDWVVANVSNACNWPFEDGYYRIVCNWDNPRRVTAIQYCSNEIDRPKLEGTLPPSLGNLGAMTKFEMTFNLLTGALPHSLFNASSIQHIIMNNNVRISGQLPTTLAPTLKQMSAAISTLDLTGPIPDVFFTQEGLQEVGIGYNNYSPRMLPQSGYPNSLRVIQCGKCHLFGPIPAAIFNLPAISNIQFQDNNITGTLPNTASSTIDYIDLNVNFIHGTIPEAFTSLPQLKFITIRDNFLTGTLPQLWGSKLEGIAFGENLLTGTLPVGLGALNFTRPLVFDRNRFKCPIPQSVWDSFQTNSDLGRELLLEGNGFEIIDGKLCGKYPPDTKTFTAQSRVAPFVESLPSSIPTFEEKNIFETRYIRVCVSGRYVYFFFRGPQGFIQSEYVTWIVSTIEGWSEYEFFEGFSSGFEKIDETNYHISGRFTNGVKVTLTITVKSNGNSLKIGFILRDPPAVDPNILAPVFLPLVQHIRAAINENGLPRCQRPVFLENLWDIFTGLVQEQLYQECLGSHTNFTQYFYPISPTTGMPYLKWNYLTPTFDVSFIWDVATNVDGDTSFISTERDADGVFDLYNLRNRPIPEGTELVVPPLDQQSMSTMLRLKVAKFKNQLVYDPEIILNTLFDVGEPNTGVIVGSVVGVVALLGIGAALAAHPTTRAKLFPFMKRSKNSSSAGYNSKLNDDTSSTPTQSQWQHSKNGTRLTNMST